MYKNYEDYSQNDLDFLMRILGDRLFEDQEEIFFEDGSSYKVLGGDRKWFLDGQYHREDGPAVEWADGSKSWWVNGARLSESEFNAHVSGPELTVELTVAQVEELLGYRVKIVK